MPTTPRTGGMHQLPPSVSVVAPHRPDCSGVYTPDGPMTWRCRQHILFDVKGYWMIGDADDMRRGIGWLATCERHQGMMPWEVPAWRYFTYPKSGSGMWFEDPSIVVKAVREPWDDTPSPPGGSKWKVVGGAGAVLRETTDLNSPVVAQIPPGSVVTVLELQGRRARIASPPGWGSISASTGEAIIVPFVTLGERDRDLPLCSPPRGPPASPTPIQVRQPLSPTWSEHILPTATLTSPKAGRTTARGESLVQVVLPIRLQYAVDVEVDPATGGQVAFTLQSAEEGQVAAVEKSQPSTSSTAPVQEYSTPRNSPNLRSAFTDGSSPQDHFPVVAVSDRGRVADPVASAPSTPASPADHHEDRHSVLSLPTTQQHLQQQHSDRPFLSAASDNTPRQPPSFASPPPRSSSPPPHPTPPETTPQHSPAGPSAHRTPQHSVATPLLPQAPQPTPQQHATPAPHQPSSSQLHQTASSLPPDPSPFCAESRTQQPTQSPSTHQQVSDQHPQQLSQHSSRHSQMSAQYPSQPPQQPSYHPSHSQPQHHPSQPEQQPSHHPSHPSQPEQQPTPRQLSRPTPQQQPSHPPSHPQPSPTQQYSQPPSQQLYTPQTLPSHAPQQPPSQPGTQQHSQPPSQQLYTPHVLPSQAPTGPHPSQHEHSAPQQQQRSEPPQHSQPTSQHSQHTPQQPTTPQQHSHPTHDHPSQPLPQQFTPQHHHHPPPDQQQPSQPTPQQRSPPPSQPTAQQPTHLSHPTPQHYSQPTSQQQSHPTHEQPSHPTPQFSQPTPQQHSHPTPSQHSQPSQQHYSQPTPIQHSHPTPQQHSPDQPSQPIPQQFTPQQPQPAPDQQNFSQPPHSQPTPQHQPHPSQPESHHSSLHSQSSGPQHLYTPQALPSQAPCPPQQTQQGPPFLSFPTTHHPSDPRTAPPDDHPKSTTENLQPLLSLPTSNTSQAHRPSHPTSPISHTSPTSSPHPTPAQPFLSIPLSSHQGHQGHQGQSTSTQPPPRLHSIPTTTQPPSNSHQQVSEGHEPGMGDKQWSHVSEPQHQWSEMSHVSEPQHHLSEMSSHVSEPQHHLSEMSSHVSEPHHHPSHVTQRSEPHQHPSHPSESPCSYHEVTQHASERPPSRASERSSRHSGQPHQQPSHCSQSSASRQVRSHVSEVQQPPSRASSRLSEPNQHVSQVSQFSAPQQHPSHFSKDASHMPSDPAGAAHPSQPMLSCLPSQSSPSGTPPNEAPTQPQSQSTSQTPLSLPNSTHTLPSQPRISHPPHPDEFHDPTSSNLSLPQSTTQRQAGESTFTPHTTPVTPGMPSSDPISVHSLTEKGDTFRTPVSVTSSHSARASQQDSRMVSVATTQAPSPPHLPPPPPSKQLHDAPVSLTGVWHIETRNCREHADSNYSMEMVHHPTGHLAGEYIRSGTGPPRPVKGKYNIHWRSAEVVVEWATGQTSTFRVHLQPEKAHGGALCLRGPFTNDYDGSMGEASILVIPSARTPTTAPSTPGHIPSDSTPSQLAQARQPAALPMPVSLSPAWQAPLTPHQVEQIQAALCRDIAAALGVPPSQVTTQGVGPRARVVLGGDNPAELQKRYETAEAFGEIPLPETKGMLRVLGVFHSPPIPRGPVHVDVSPDSLPRHRSDQAAYLPQTRHLVNLSPPRPMRPSRQP